MWHNLNVRTRILLGYGLILGLTSLLVLFLALRLGDLNNRISQLNTIVALEADAGARLAAQVAITQQAVDRYLQQPSPTNLQTAQETLEQLQTDVDAAPATVYTAEQQQQVTDLVNQVAAYTESFVALNDLINEQNSIRSSLNTQLFTSSTAVNTAVADYLFTTDVSMTVKDELTAIQRSLLLVNLWTDTLSVENADEQGQSILDELQRARTLLENNTAEADDLTGMAVGTTLDDITRAANSTEDLLQNLRAVQQERQRLLDEQGTALNQQASAIAREALNTLTDATVALEREIVRIQQAVLVAVATTLILGVVLAGILARTITHPLSELVAATRRLHQGDYTATVPQQDDSELGQLGVAFNEMTTTLEQQRREVLQRQADLTSQNQELEQALEEIRTTTAARDALAVTVRQLSVPVISILDRVIVVPLVGELDEARAHLLMERLLQGITDQQAHTAILDITGVPLVDIATADWLIKSADAARLLGTRCVLVGIRPEVAQEIVASGADLANIVTKADLRSAVEYTMHQSPRRSNAYVRRGTP